MPRSLRYNVESLEPRYLLSAVALTNATNDGTKPVDTSYVTAVNKAVQTVVVGQAASQSIIGGLSYLGQQVDKTSIGNNSTASTKVPLLNQTPNQLGSMATTGGGFGSQAGNITFGSLLLNETDGSGNNLFTQDLATFLSNSTNANALTSATLAGELQREGQALFGNAFTVTDKSAGSTLDLQFSFTADTYHTVPIDIGGSASEYNILLSPEATGSPTALVETKLSATYDITADLSSFNTAYNSGNTSTQKATAEANSFSLVTTANSFQQSAQVAANPLSTFGIEFGVIGAGSPGIIENGATLTNNSTTLGLGSVAGLSVGMSVLGAGIQAHTTITGIDAVHNTVTLSNAASATATEQVTIGAANGAYVNASAFVEGSVAITSGSSQLTLGSVTGMAVGMAVQGTGIANGTTITAVDATHNKITLSNPATATSVGTVTINATAALALNEQMSLQITNGTLSYPNIAAAAYQFTAPVASNPTSVTIGTSAAPNTAELNTGVIGVENLSTLPGYVGNLNLTGSFTLYSDNVFDGHPALVYPGSSELANLARVTNADIVVDAQNAVTLITELGNNTNLQSNVPFTSETLSDAYAFGTATQLGFVNALQATSVVLAGSLSPGTYNTTTQKFDNTDLSGSTTFNLEVILSTGEVDNYAVYVAGGSPGRTIQTLANDLQTALQNATQYFNESITAVSPNKKTLTLASVDGLTVGMAVQGTGIQSSTTISSINTATNQVTLSLATTTSAGNTVMFTQTADVTGKITASANGSVLQLTSNVSGIQYFLSNFKSDTPGANVLNLGFNTFGSVALYANGDLNTAANYQIPGVGLTSTSAVNLSDFNTQTQFGIKVNNGTSSTYGPGYVTVSLAAGSYTQQTLVSGLTTALQQALLSDGFDTNGVQVRSFALGSGFGLQFYGGDDVYKLDIQNISTPGSISAISKFQLTTQTVTAPSFNLSINGGAATTYYLNGNFTNGLLDDMAPSASLNDLVHDLQLALVASGVLAADGSSGITVSSSATPTGNELVFAAVNPGSGTNQISRFSITGETGLDSLNLIGSGANDSLHWAFGQSVTQPAFVTIQDLEILLLQKGVMQAGTYGDYDSTSEVFTFPLNFTVNSSRSSTDFPDLNVPLSFADTYGSVSNLQSSSTVDMRRSDNIQFDFGFNVTPRTSTGEVLTATLPIVIPFWDNPTFQELQSNSPLLFQISTSDGVVHTLQLNQVPQSNGTSKFYPSSDASSTATNFISALNTALSEANLQVTAAFSAEDDFGRTQIVFTTTAGAYTELVVTVPATSSGVVSVADSAWSNLGFGASSGTSKSVASNSSNQIAGSSAVQFVVVNTNNTIPNKANFYVTLPDGTNSGFTLNPANLPANASLTDVINELNYEIASTTELLGSSFGAIGTSTLKMSLVSGSTTATLDSTSMIDPTPYVDGSGNVGAGFGLIPGGTLTGTGLAAGTTIQAITYDSTTHKVNLTLSQAATSTTTNGSVTVTANPAAAEYNILPKLIASLDSTNTKIIFSLNPQVFGPGQQTWNLQVSSTYLQQLDNPASLELGLPATSVVDSTVPATGIISAPINANTFINWNTVGLPASFQVSIDGSNYVAVNINENSLASQDIAGLISAFNTAFANKSINLSVPGAPNSTTYHLNQFLHAEATNGGKNVLIRLVNGATPAVSGARIAIAPGANVMSNPGILGFFSSTGPSEYIFGQRGAEAVVSSPILTGTLNISGATFSGTAQFGFVNFNIGNGILNEKVSLTLSSTNSSSSLLDLDQAIADADAPGTDFYKSYGITILPTTQADVLLEQLSFPGASSISGLSFGSGAVIEIAYPLSTAAGANGHYITDFSNLPPAEVNYFHTNGMELLTRLGFTDIANGLIQIGNLVSGWMATNVNDPYSSSLLFSRLSLQQVDDIGADFAGLVQLIELQPPGSLQNTAQVLENGLGLPAGSLHLSITNTTTEDSNGVLANGGQLALQISFDWIKSLTQTLPLSVDLATMYDKASANNGTGQTPQIDLLGLNAIAGSGVNPLNVLLTEVSSLNVNLNLVVAQADSSSVLPEAIQPEAILNQPSSGNFFQTKFFLTGDNLSGELPAGVDYLQLTNGSVAIDATGQTDIPFASQSSTGMLILTNSTGQETSSVAVSGTTNGSVTVNYDAAGDNGILIQGVTTLPFGVPVVNGTITGSGLFTIGSVIAPGVTLYATDSTHHTLILGSVSGLKVGMAVSGTGIPTGTTITAIDATNQRVTLNNAVTGSFTAGQQISIGGIAPAVNSQILVNSADNFTILANTAYSSTNPAQNYVLSGIATSVFAGLAVGQGISGSFLPNGTTIVSIDATNHSITLSKPISGTGTQNQGVFFIHQAAGSVNGLYTVTQNSSSGYVLTLVQSISAINASTNPNQRYVITSASGNVLANQVYQASSAVHFDAVTTSPNNLDAYGTPFTYDLSAASTFASPTVVNVLTASTTSLTPTSSSQTANLWTLHGSGNSLTLDGYAMTTAGQVLLNHQATASQNGLYNLTFSGGNWTLTQISTPANLNVATRYNVQHGTVYGNVLMGAYGGTQFAVMLQPASYSYNLQTVNGSASEILPYTVSAVTDQALSGVAASGSIPAIPALTSYANGVFTSLAKVNLNSQVFTEADGSIVNGIDGVGNLTVGSLVLVKDEVGANAYENGVYVVTNLGSSTSSWTMERADFALTPAQVLNLRVAVNQGHANAGGVWAQTDSALANTSLLTAGVAVTFSNQLGLVYKNGTSTWLSASMNGAAAANLPLQLVQVNDDGTQSLINRDLGLVNADAKTALGNDGSSITNDPLYNYYQSLQGSMYVIQPTAVFSSLQIVIPNLNNFYTSPSSGTLFFNPAPGFTPSNTNTQNNPPALVNSATSASVLTQLQNGFYIGDALDLALFSIQSAMDLAMGIQFPLLGTNLNLYTSYVEQIRRTLTNNIRNQVLANPLVPVDDIRNALFATLGNNPGGLGYLTDENQITVKQYTGSTATNFDFTQSDLVNYVQTPLGLKNTVAGSVDAITFSIELAGSKTAPGHPGYNDTKINQVDLGDSTIGAVINTSTVSSTGASTTGGVDLQTFFNFNFGFGVSTSTGFFIFNPTSLDATPPAATSTHNSPLSMIDVNVIAQLTGNINATAVTPFVQTGYLSTLQGLQVNVADGRATTDTVANGGDGYASGFFGDFIFDLNNHITPGSDPLGRTTTGTGKDVYATVDDLRQATELGPNVTTSALKPSALLNFAINADADIDLLIESKQAGLVPAIQSDLVEAERFGTGAASSFLLNFQNNALIGLGNQTLGTTVMGDYNSYYSATTADNNNAAYNALSVKDKEQIDTDYGNASPMWRFERNLLASNGQSGQVFYAYQNLSVDVYDYLTGPFFKSLINLENAIAPLRPVLNFITTPVPGTTWMPGGGLVLINLFPATASPKSTSPTEKSNAGNGAKAASVLAAFSLLIQILHSIDNMLGPLASLAATASSTDPWQHPQANIGGQAGWSNKPLQLNGLTDQVNAQRLQLYKETQISNNIDRQLLQDHLAAVAEQQKNLANLTEPRPYEPEMTPAQQNQNSISKALSSLSEAATTPTKYSETFNSLQNGEFFDTTKGNALTKAVKNGINDKTVQNDQRAGQYSITVGISGGAFYLQAFSQTSILQLLNGQNANLLQVQLPAISVTFGYMKTFPLPAFPPLQLRLGINFTIKVDFNFGYDAKGFYWNTIDLTTGKPAPLFSFAVGFSVGVGLNFGFVSVSIDLLFTVTVGFIWNDVSGTGVLHQTDIDYLTAHGKSLFAVELKGEIGFHFELDLTIPLLFTTITVPIFQYTYMYTIFDYTLGTYHAHIELGAVTNGVLELYMGPYAANRAYVDTSNRNEVFYVYGYNQGASAGAIQSSGETVIVEYISDSTTYYEEFTGVKQVIGYAGVGDSSIYAGTADTLASAITLVDGTSIGAGTILTALNYAVVDFYGGAGNVVLQAGASYYSGWATTSGRSRLVGGTGTSFLDGQVSNRSLDLIAGLTTTTIEGSTAGGDNIVARQGSDVLYGNGPNDVFTFTNGFGHDRIYATGNGNSVNFSGLTLGASGTAAGLVPSLNISAVTTSIDFQFGQLVDSAVTGNSTVFWAVDPSENNSIDTWTGGTGGDKFTVFFFAPNQTLNLNETINSGANTYDIYLGDPNIHYYVPGDSRNTGTINIHDNSHTQGQVFLTQLFSNTISYNNSMVSNGREQMTFSPSLAVSLDAPNSTLYWGDPNHPSAYTTQAGGTISVGHLVLLGNVLLTSNAIIHLTHSFLLNYDIDVEGGTVLNPASIEFDLRSNNPSVDANFVLANNSATGSPSRLMISTGTSQDGAGIGNIFLNLYTGSILNQSGTTNYGIIELGTGTLVMLALESIGTITSPINVKVQNLAAKTTSALNPLFDYGIFLYSSQNLNLTGYGSVSGNHDDNILGVTTVNGDIWISVAPTYTLTYYQLIAGGSGNVTIIADHVSITAGFDVIENILQAVPHTYTYSYVYYYPEFVTYSINYFFFQLYYTELIYLPVVFTYSYTYYTYEILPTAVTIQPSGAKIQGSGDLTIENASSGANIQVGGSALLPSATGLLVSDAVLGSVVTGFATLTIGRSKPSGGGATTGTLTLAHAENFTQASGILLQGTNLVIDYSVSASNLLTFNAYNVGNNSVTFTNQSNVYQASTLVLTTDQTAALTLHGLFLSTAAGGSVQISTDGDLNLDGSIAANHGNASQILIDAAGAITVDNKDQLIVSGSTHYNSLSAYSGLGDTLSKISLNAGTKAGIGIGQSTVDANSGIIAANMSLSATGSIILSNIQMDTLLLASGSSLNLTNRTLLASLWTINAALATSGSITLTDSTAGIQLVRTIPNALIDLVSTTASGQSVSITSGGVFTGDSTGSVLDISTTNLTLRTSGEITGASSTANLLIHAAQLDAVTSAAGDLRVSNINSPITLKQVVTYNGLISLQSNNDITVTKVQSQTSSINNSVSLSTTLGQHGNINLGNLVGSITGVVDAGALGAVTLSADGLIAGALSGTDISAQLDLITGASVSLTSNATAGAGNNAILAAVKTAYLDAVANNTGQIQIYTLSPAKTGVETSENLYLHDLKTAQGNIVVLGAATSPSNLPLNFITGDVNAQASDLTLETTGTITQNTNARTSADILSGLIFQLHAGLLTTQSTGTSYLNTAVVSLDAQVFGTGDLTVIARGTVDVYRATTLNGTITITDDGVGTADSIRVGTINAGKTAGAGTKSDVVIDAFDGNILDLNAAHNNVGAVPFNLLVTQIGALTGLTAARFTANNDPNADSFGIAGLTTQIDTLDAYTTQNLGTAQIILTQTGDVTIDTVDMSGGGSFALTSNGNITVNSLVTNQTLGQQVTLDTSAGWIKKSAGTLATTPNITGSGLNLQSVNGIDLNTDISILTATNSGGTDVSRKNIVLANLATAELDVSQVAASHGNIDLSTKGDLVLKNLPLGQTVYFSTPTNGASSVTPYHISVTTGGVITGGTSGTGATSLFDFVTDNLTLSGAAGLTGLGDNSSLVTQVSTLTATTSGAGDIRDTNRGALELINIDADNGLIFIQNDAAMIVDAVKIDTSATANTITLQNTLGASAANITLGTVNAGALGNVTMTSTGLILGRLNNLITGKVLTLTAEGLAGSTNAAIDVNVLGSVLTANATGSGEIIIHTAGDLTLDQVDTVSGDIHVTTTGTASLLISEVEAGTGVSFANDVYLTVAGTIGEYKPTPVNAQRTYKIVGDLLTVLAGGTTYLDTTIHTLDASVTGVGSLTVDQTDGITITEALTTNGAITIHADTGVSPANYLNSNILVGQIKAGTAVTGGSDVTLTTTGGYIQNIDNSSLVSGATFTATTYSGIHGLNTAVSTLDATSTATLAQGADMTIVQTGDLLIDVVSMTEGNFKLTADANITVNSLSSDLLASQITLITTGGWIDKKTGTLATSSNITGYNLNLQAVNGIDLNTDISILTATNSGGTDVSRKNIVLANLATTELDVSQVAASHGNIDLSTKGDLVLKNLPLGQTVYFSTPTNGASSATPYHISVTTGGVITGGTSGTGATSLFDFVTDNLTLSGAAGLTGLGDNSSLVTQVSTLTATTSGAGDIRDTNRGALELINIDADNGLIFIQNDAAMIVDAVKIDTSATANTITLQNTLGASAANITLATVNAGALGNVTMTSTGLILGRLNNLITGKVLTLTAEGLAGSTNAAIDVNVLGSVLTANATGSGEIIIHTAGDLTLDQVDTVSGDIHVTTTGTASLLISEVEAGTGVSFANDVYLTVAGTIGEYKPTPVNAQRTYKIVGDLLTVLAGGTTYLDTVIQTLDATVTGNGFMTVDQTGNLNVYNASTANGAITIHAIPAGQQSGANIFIGTLTAGAPVPGLGDGASNVNLTASGGFIQDLDVATITDPAIVPPLNYAPLLTGATFTATTDLGIQGLHTDVTTLDATSTAQSAFMLIWDKDDINIDHVHMPFGNFTLTAGGTIDVNDLAANTGTSTVNLTSLNSRIKQEVGKINANIVNAVAATGIQSLTNIHDLTATITGAGGDINFQNDGSLNLEHAFTPSGTFTLNILSGALTPSLLTNPVGTPPVYHVYANNVIVNTTDGIGVAADFLSVYADEVVQATASSSGGIYIHNYKQTHSGAYPNGFELHQVLANNGPVSIISSGNTYARDIEIHQDANLNDITLTTTDGGNILLNFVGTGLSDAVPGSVPPQNGLANFISAGNIEAVDPGLITMLQPVNIVAKGIKFSAQTGIGGGNVSPQLTGVFLSASTVTGNISSGNSSSTEFFISDFSTGAGNLTFTQKGGGALHAQNLVTLQGNLGLTVGNGAYLFLVNTISIGNTTLDADHINFQGGTGSVYGTGVLSIFPNNPAQYVQLNSMLGSTVYEAANTLEITKIGFAAFFTNFQTILIGNLNSPQLTYSYFDVYPMDEFYNGLNPDRFTSNTQVPSSNPNPDAFRVTELFLSPTEVAVLQVAANDQFYQILNTELNLGSDDSGNAVEDEADTEGDVFAFATPAPIQSAPMEFHDSYGQHNENGASAMGSDSASANDSWIDRAPVAMALASPVAMALKPKSWLGKVLRNIAGRNRD